MKKLMIFLLLCAGFGACHDSDDKIPDIRTVKNKFRVCEITGQNSHWGEFSMHMVYYYERLDSVVVKNAEGDTIALMTAADNKEGYEYNLYDYIPAIDADSVRKLEDKYGKEVAKDSIPLVERKLYTLKNEVKKEVLTAQTFMFYMPQEDAGIGSDFNNKYLNHKRMRYIYEYDESGYLLVCRMFEDVYDRAPGKNDNFNRRIYKSVLQYEEGQVKEVIQYQAEEEYESAENYRLYDTYGFVYTGGQVSAVNGNELNMQYQYEGGRVKSITREGHTVSYSYNADGFLKKIDSGHGEYMEMKYESGNGNFHVFTPLIEQGFYIPFIR